MVCSLIENNERDYTQTVLCGNVVFVLISDEFKYENYRYPFYIVII